MYPILNNIDGLRKVVTYMSPIKQFNEVSGWTPSKLLISPSHQPSAQWPLFCYEKKNRSFDFKLDTLEGDETKENETTEIDISITKDVG